jgi:surface antigen
MILFTVILSLIGLGFTLLFLPFRIMRMGLGLVLLPVRIVVHLLTRNIFLLGIMVIAVVLYAAIRSSSHNLPELTPATAQPQMKNGQVLVDPVRKKEDGDSAFATDLYATMTDAERAAYSQHYYWAMANLPDGQEHLWTEQNIGGTLRANDNFANNSGARCRHFNEILKVHAIEQTLSGTACQQDNGSWCKLKPNATPACNLGGYQPGVMDTLKNLF